MKKPILSCLIAVAVAAGLAENARADEESDLKKSVAELNAAAKSPAGEQKALQHAATETGVPVEKLKAQRDQHQLGVGEVFIANRLATQTGKPVEEIIGQFKSGTGWGKIAKDNNVKLGPLVSEAKKAGNAVKQDAKGARKEGKTEKPEKVRPQAEKKSERLVPKSFPEPNRRPGGAPGGPGKGGKK